MNTQQLVELRHLELDDYRDLKSAMVEAYSDIGGLTWSEDAIRSLLEIFPEGQLCVIVDGRVAACALAIIVDYDHYGDKHTYAQITGNYSFRTHDPKGDVLYGIEIFVHPQYRGLRLGRRLYDARKELCENLNLRAIVAGGRIPNYSRFADTLTPRDYIEKVRMKEIYDQTLTFQLSNGFHVRKVLKNYLPGDTSSLEFATLLAWNNIYFEGTLPLIKRPKVVVRIGVVQWQMRSFDGIDAMIEQVEYFVDAVSDYKSDFILFPELFNAPLMAEFNHLGEARAIRELAAHSSAIRDHFSRLAVSYNVNIIAGSMPVMEDGHLYNVSYLCRRDGTGDEYRKIHPTPSEVDAWGIAGGDAIRVFETDAGRIGILICYDVEFPELARFYADQGMQILFVPFLTDTQNGYNRVRRCAQARAIENECYVAIAGAVGNLPKVNNMDIQYAQSAIFTPSDFAFPTNSIKAEATPNTEMTIIADVDLELLMELHEHGSVRTLKDRRLDLYELRLKSPADSTGRQ
ncbi:MAG: bifunctional GNAT family N-acetyltransferase/carbon-nitrogen hydrolase family protein [Bacteroidetes bacterium]|nr:bifunctional GNAT family N-acetyltransferase/carbon-nitrogen hydrolase family protein [Bacteroidota bacterium]